MRKIPRGFFTGIMALTFCLALSGGANAAPIEYCKDMDGDGYGDSTDCVNEEEAGYVLLTGDCDDGNASINPGEIELCGDGIDNNCLNGIDEGCSGGNKQYYYLDADEDGFGDPAVWEYVANPSTGYITTAGDCNDNNPAINPGMAEICSTTDLTDENCSGEANEGCQSWWQDADNDGYSTGNNLYDMSAPTGYVLEASLASTTAIDCQDGSAGINPGMAEICSTTDLTDENCSTTANEGCQSWWQDVDNDGYSTGNKLYDISAPAGYVLEASLASTTAFDCQDGIATINPGMAEICSTTDLTDENCSNTANEGCQNWWQDEDYDHYSTGSILYSSSAPVGYVLETTLVSTTVPDCNDLNWSINPGRAEMGGADLIDQNCDGDPGPYFPDPNLEACVLKQTGGSYSETTITSLTFLNCGIKSISNLAGMEYLTGLSDLILRGNFISDITPLTNLTGLEHLELSQNPISDLTPLANLTGLNYLSLSSDSISDLTPLANLTGLNNLSLAYNSVNNLTPRANLNLTPLANLTNLSYLILQRNPISDLTPLADLSHLYYLDLGSCSLTNLTGLENLTRLMTLSIHENSVSDLTPLANLRGLYKVDLSENSITDLTPLANATGITRLYLDNNSISDLTPLANLRWLFRLYAGSNAISDLTPLANLTELHELSLNNNSISDLTGLDNLTGLTYLGLSYNFISDLTELNNLTGLTSLNLSYNSISNLSPLANLTNLDYLYLNNNSISTLTPLTNLIDLYYLRVDYNCITDFTPVAQVENVVGMTPQCM